MSFAINRMYHPSHRVTNLPEVAEFFKTVFGRSTLSRNEVYSYLNSKPPEGFPTEYCQFTGIVDVYFDSIDPSKLVINGKQAYSSITENHLYGFGWVVDSGIEEIYKILWKNGYGSTLVTGERADPEHIPTNLFNDSKLFFTIAADTGIRLEVYEARVTPPADPRNAPGYKLGPASDDDPLGIEFSLHHTILTKNPERISHVLSLLGGKVIHKGRNEARQTDSTYMFLVDSVYEIAIPTVEGSYAMEDWKKFEPEDTYHAISWKVKDLAKAAKHLEKCGVKLLYKSDSFIVTDPKTSIGIPWGFSQDQIPGDPRRIVS